MNVDALLRSEMRRYPSKEIFRRWPRQVMLVAHTFSTWSAGFFRDKRARRRSQRSDGARSTADDYIRVRTRIPILSNLAHAIRRISPTAPYANDLTIEIEIVKEDSVVVYTTYVLGEDGGRITVTRRNIQSMYELRCRATVSLFRAKPAMVVMTFIPPLGTIGMENPIRDWPGSITEIYGAARRVGRFFWHQISMFPCIIALPGWPGLA